MTLDMFLQDPKVYMTLVVWLVCAWLVIGFVAKTMDDYSYDPGIFTRSPRRRLLLAMGGPITIAVYIIGLAVVIVAIWVWEQLTEVIPETWQKFMKPVSRGT